eukprot:gnl/Dysnectes_brevis/6435_a9982_388.p1 GENE.gnl/Dysnectes_brevis/6435_a9982_388~~gnl/Dysnectes_brevis/6435_a9982_388.p1  ORF type:complete len:223 (+),score=21.71 gnl/Dysnectes_brevis/6435_a9982_388:50-718(+)
MSQEHESLTTDQIAGYLAELGYHSVPPEMLEQLQGELELHLNPPAPKQPSHPPHRRTRKHRTPPRHSAQSSPHSAPTRRRRPQSATQVSVTIPSTRTPTKRVPEPTERPLTAPAPPQRRITAGRGGRRVPGVFIPKQRQRDSHMQRARRNADPVSRWAMYNRVWKSNPDPHRKRTRRTTAPPVERPPSRPSTARPSTTPGRDPTSDPRHELRWEVFRQFDRK